MKEVIGLNGKTYKWNLSGYKVYENEDRAARSKYHLAARKLIRKVYGTYRIIEEVKLPGSGSAAKKSALFLDFYIPSIYLAVEVHGEQHYKFIPFFHKTKAGYIQAQNRDDDKKEWCRINDVDLVTLKYSDSEDDWEQQLRQR